MSEGLAPPRKLSPDEERFCQELDINKAYFLGERVDGPSRETRDPYSLVASRPLSLGKPVAGQLEALELRRNLRFGNHIYALANAYLVAEALEVGEIIIPSHPLLRDEFTIQGVRFSQRDGDSDDKKSLVKLSGNYFFRYTLGHLLDEKVPTSVAFPLFADALRGFPRFCRDELFEWFMKGFAEKAKRFRRDLTIHIRSGDIFSGDGAHPSYWQPPLSFYLSVISRVEPRQVTLVFEDRGNPVIDRIEQYLIKSGIRYRVKDGPIEEAIREILTARNLVVARGTFSRPMVAMGRNLRNLYCYADDQGYGVLSRLDTAKFTLHVIDDPERAYEARVSPWQNSEEQRETMLTW